MGTFTVIGVGMVINLAIFMIGLFLFKSSIKSANLTICAGFLCIVLAIIVGGWNGIGFAVIGIGMLLFSILLYFYMIFSSIFKRNRQK